MGSMLAPEEREERTMSLIESQIGNLALSEEQFLADLRTTTSAQLQECPAFRALCEKQGFDPGRDLKQPGDEAKIPWVTSNSYKKSHQLFTKLLRKPPPAIEVWTASSATGGDPSLVGRTREEVAAYREAYRSAFQHVEGQEHWDVSLLFWPDPEPILARSEPMISGKVEPYGLHVAFEAGLTHDPAKRQFVARFDPQTRGFSIDAAAVLEQLRQADDAGETVFIGGSPILLYQSLYRYAKEQGVSSFHLGQRCHVQFGAGGWSGRKGSMVGEGPIPKQELIPGLCQLLGLESSRQVADMWGSTETSFAMPAHFSDQRGDFLFHELPWARVLLRDPETLEPIAEAGRPGLLEVITPYGVDSFAGAAVLIDDILEEVEAKGDPECGLARRSFHFVGRAQGAEAKGCGVMASEWVEEGLS
jgi:Acyl-protein synthetase, LuxE